MFNKIVVSMIFAMILISLSGAISFVHAEDLQASDAASQTSEPNPEISPIIKYGASDFKTTYFLGKVTNVTQDGEIVDAQQKLLSQQVSVKLSTGKEISVENDYIAKESKLSTGQQVIVMAVDSPTKISYTIVDKYRSPAVMVLAVLFFLLVIFLARGKGFMAIVGLAFSILVIMKWEIPAILSGANPFLTSLGVAALIAIVSLYLAHGFTKRTTIAVMSTFITLVIAIVLAMTFVRFSQLTGQGSEEAFYLQVGAVQNINLIGLLLGGIIIGALGVLDDITTAQVAVVFELKLANQKLGLSDLYRRALVVGKEHIASLINLFLSVSLTSPIHLIWSDNLGSTNCLKYEKS